MSDPRARPSHGYAAHRDIFDQAPSLRRTLAEIGEGAGASRLGGAFARWRPRGLVLLGCGSSYCVALSVAAAMQRRLGIPARAVVSGDYLRHPAQYAAIMDGAALVALSRSGETTETVMAARDARTRYGAHMVAVDCAGPSVMTPLRELADVALSIPWARDEGVCQTRGVSNLLLAGMATCSVWAGDRALLADLHAAVEAAQAFLDGPARDLDPAPEAEDVVLLGDGELYGAASEATLLFTEMARAPAVAHYTLDVRHGPTVRIGPGTLVILFASREGAPWEADLVADLRATAARVLPVCAAPPGHAPAHARDGVAFPAELCDAAFAVVAGLVPQVLALRLAIAHGIDPDRPPGLSPWIALRPAPHGHADGEGKRR